MLWSLFNTGVRQIRVCFEIRKTYRDVGPVRLHIRCPFKIGSARINIQVIFIRLSWKRKKICSVLLSLRCDNFHGFFSSFFFRFFSPQQGVLLCTCVLRTMVEWSPTEVNWLSRKRKKLISGCTFSSVCNL